MGTTTQTRTVKLALDAATPGEFESAAQKAKLGTMLTPISETITLASVRDHIHLLTDSVAAKAAQQVLSCRVSSVVGGTGAAGPRHITDVNGTPGAPGANGPGIATISANGDIITFEGTVKAVVISWLPLPDVATSTALNS